MSQVIEPSRIRLLPEGVSNQIAAGEVVERPANALKELIENALDAGADRIQVEIQGGGRRLIRVVDNGCGMGPDDLLMALERHATSKVRTSRDLDRVATLGFRGEALPSMAAVSRLKLRSRTREAETGSEALVVGGTVREVRQAACPAGTLVEVKDLFFNTPARRKFLKSMTTESSHLLAAFTRLALANCQAAFSYKSAGRPALNLPAADDCAPRVAALLGRGRMKQMTPVDSDQGVIRISGLVGLPSLSRAAYDQCYIYVNGRHVRDKVLLHAAGQAYTGLLPQGRRPVMVVFIEMDPALVDVNVHPAKTEVRFRQSQEVHRAFAAGLRRALAGAHIPVSGQGPDAQSRPAFQQGGPAPALSSPAQNTQNAFRPTELRSQQAWAQAPHQVTGQGQNAPSAAFTAPYEHETEDRSSRPGVALTARPLFTASGDLTVLGQLHGLYIVCASPEGLVLIDQHAAHERMNYEALKAGILSGDMPRQGLLAPVTVELTPDQALTAEAQAEAWARLGLEISHFGGGTWAISTTPLFMDHTDPASMLQDLISELSQAGLPPDAPEFLDAAMRSLACRSSIKSGQRLGREELTALAAKVAALPPPVTCPHGRPVMLTMNRHELARSFGRGHAPGEGHAS